MSIESDGCDTNHGQKEPKNSKMKTKLRTKVTVKGLCEQVKTEHMRKSDNEK